MSEVKRYLIQKTPIGTMMKPNPEGNWVASEDFDRVTAERDAARAELALANEKIDKAWNRTTAIDHKGFIPGAMDAWKRPVPQHLPYDFSGSTSASTIQYCNGWNDSGSYWSAHAANLSKKVDALQQRLTAADERVDVLETALKKISVRCVAYIDAEREMPESSVEVCQMIAYAALKPAEGGGDDTTLEEDREDFKKVFVRINTKQGQSISLADMIARYEKKP